MRIAPTISDVWDAGGPFRARTVVTVQEPWDGADPDVRDGDEDHVIHPALSVSVGRRASRGLPFRWYQKADNSQTEREIPNVKSVSIDRSIETDAATCSITLTNQWMYDNGAVPTEHLTEGNRHLNGYFTPTRGSHPDAQARWGQEANEWENVLLPNAIIRTYQGYLGATDASNKSLEDCLEDGNLILTGAWLIDEVRVGTDGELSIECRDMGKLLIDQQLYPPLIPSDRYPLSYYRYVYDNFAVAARERTTTQTNTQQVAPGDKRAAYVDSSVDRWYGAGTVLHGHGGLHSIDRNAGTYWLSEGNSGPDREFATVWIEYSCGEAMNAVYVQPWGGNYEMYISVKENGQWQGSSTVPYDHSELIGNQPHVVDQGADIRYVKKVGVGWETGATYVLPRTYQAERVRITFRHLTYSGIGPWYYRAGVREFRIRATAAAGSITTGTTTTTVRPYFWAADSVRNPANLNAEGYITVSQNNQIDAFGDARLFPRTVGNLPTSADVFWIALTHPADGYWTLHSDGAVVSYGAAGYFGSPKDEGLAASPTATTGAWSAICPTSSGLGYWVVHADGRIRAYGDAVAVGLPTTTPGFTFTVGGDYISGASSLVNDDGLLIASTDGTVYALGAATHYGNFTESSDSLSSVVPNMDGDGYWMVSLSGRVQAAGAAVDYGQIAVPDTVKPANWVDQILPTASDLGYLLMKGIGNIFAFGDATYYGSPIPNSIGQIRRDGNYTDYADIIKDLALWAGFLLFDPALGGDQEPSVFGNIETTGSFSKEQLPDEIFDKRPVIDAMTDIKEAVGYLLFVDDEGGLRFESPNFWSYGNWDQATGERVMNIPEIDEQINLFDYGTSRNDESLRSLIIISSEDPDETGETTITTSIVPQTAQGLRGLMKPAMWVNGWFQDQDEQKIMAELIAMHIWFAQRLGQVTSAANPCIQINDQVRIFERTTSEIFVHYVRGVNTTHNLESGEYTMTLTTHWLGTGEDWAITDSPLYLGDENHYVISPKLRAALERRDDIPQAGLGNPGAPEPSIITPDPAPVDPEEPEDPGSGPEQPAATFAFGFPVYSAADIAAWSTSAPEYTDLAASGAASLAITPVVFGSQISSAARDTGLKDQSGYAKVQAVLWAADGDIARKNKVFDYLDEYRSVTSFQWDSAETWRLVAGWGCTNLAQAAAITGYDDEDFKRFLTDVAYPIMDWPGNPNWVASFADSKLAIAAYVGDTALWADAKRYFYERISQCIFHSSYDGSSVRPWHTEDGASGAGTSSSSVSERIHETLGTNNLGLTQSAWGNNAKSGFRIQINDDYTINTSVAPEVDGMDAERMRDLGHVNMSLGGWMHAARTILAQGDTLEDHAYARLLAAYGYHGQRVLTYETTGVISNPTVTEGNGGGNRYQAWYGGRKLLGDDTPTPVLSMLARSEVIDYPPGGANHMVAEQFADGGTALPSGGSGGLGDAPLGSTPLGA